jgi:Rne/Rng family ribonuclease
MAKEICISSTPHETRLAILEDDQLAEIYYERENEYTLAGSIYNGKVTRVLPGMQSAFVDLGLERDAFLYVTDFIELEDQEETDELERAAAGGQAPREIQHGHERNGGRQDEQGPREDRGRHDERGQRQGQRQDAQAGQFRQAEEAATGTVTPGTTATGGQGHAGADRGDAEGGRWRGGRRRRRGGRGPGGAGETQSGSGRGFEQPRGSEARMEETHEAPADTNAYPALTEEAGYSPTPISRTGSAASSAAIVLPGESLSKYGGAPAAEAKASQERIRPTRPQSSSKPSTMVEAPLSWDGSGLLPGESLSRHRGRSEEPASETVAKTRESTDEELESSADSAQAGSPDEFFEEMEELVPPARHEIEGAAPQEQAIDFVEHSIEHGGTMEVAREEDARSTDPEVAGSGISEAGDETAEAGEEQDDASASHRVDPSAPTGFRLFGFGGKKKKDDDAGVGTAEANAPVATAAKSTYAPGAGLVEEEVIEGEEFDAPHAHRHKAQTQDLDEYEEETLPTHLRTGELGEMLQEAHLDHRIQMNFDEKGVEEETFETTGDEEAPADAHAQPGRDHRRPRGGREQRGRGAQGGRRGPARRSAQTSDLPIISDLLKSGQEILVQIAKEPIAKKGARITSHIALPGRFLVFMPTVSHVGVSRKIASDEERHRLKRILTNERGEASGGFIVRTAAEGASEEELRADLRFLMNLWDEIKQRSESSKSPALIYHDLSLIERILRDQVSSNFASIWVDTQEDYERIVRFLNRFSPDLVRRVKLYTKDVPLFEHFGIQDEISKALRSKVWLKSGGSIVINQTEALVAIDINTGKYVGKSARLEDTILKTNLDAVPEIVRQIRLRDLGGIIVIDFIDMDERKNRFKVMAALEEALKNDRAPTKVLQFNDFGLVAITRKRVKQSLERTLSVPCEICQGTGMTKSPMTVCNEIYIEMRKMQKHLERNDVLLRVHPEVVKTLKANNARWLNEIEEMIGKTIIVKSDPALHPEQFDIH